MIARLTGSFELISDSQAILDVRGVGYEICCSQSSIMDFEAQPQNVSAYIFTHVREDTLQLFGFSSLAEKKLFLSLISVNGVGPKVALGLLSAASTDQILLAIENQDAKFLAKLPKIGKKKAEQMILSLRGKLVLDEVGPQLASITTNKKDITSALSNLGFILSDVETVVSKMPSSIDVQDGIREGLSQLGAQF
jgi:Holliday junction DNA helicase RuvA